MNPQSKPTGATKSTPGALKTCADCKWHDARARLDARIAKELVAFNATVSPEHQLTGQCRRGSPGAMPLEPSRTGITAGSWPLVRGAWDYCDRLDLP